MKGGSDIATPAIGWRGQFLLRHLTGQMGRQVIATFGTKLGATLATFVASALVARALGPDGRGAFATVAALASIGIQFGSLGLQASNTYFISRDRSLLPRVVANSTAVSLVFGGIAAAGLAVSAWWTGTAASVGYLPLFTGLAGVPLTLAYTLLINVLIARLDVTQFNLIELGLRIATFVLTLAVVFGWKHAGPTAYLAAGIVARCLALFATYYYLGVPLRTILTSASARLLKLHVPYAFRAYIGSFLAFMLLRSDMLIVQRLSGNAEAGNYSIAVSMADAMYLLPATIGLLLFPRLAAENDQRSRRRSTWRYFLLVGLLMAVFSGVADLLAGPAIALVFGKVFAPAVPMFYLLSVAIVAYGVNNILSNHMAAEGMPWKAVWVWGVALVVNVALNFLWVPALGGDGAALASIVGYSLVLVVQIWMVFGRRGARA